MKIFESPRHEQPILHTILAADIGGTNTTFALIGVNEESYTLLSMFAYKTREITDFHTSINTALSNIQHTYSKNIIPLRCCLSAAGPVKNNVCRMTNTSLVIDGDEITRKTGIPTIVINDFLALSYTLPLLQVEDRDYILKVPHPDGSLPEPTGEARTVIGAGTGLGVGYMMQQQDRIFAFPSEGGNTDFAAFDDLTEELKNFVEDTIGDTPGTELFISGQGLKNIYYFFKERKNIATDDVIRSIDNSPDTEKPEMIAKACKEDHPVCAEVMRLFIQIYGKFAGNTALTFLPTAGLFLAGGIVTKNHELFQNRPDFMQHFEMNYKSQLRTVLKEIPVYIIRRYSVSLFGAAHAASMII